MRLASGLIMFGAKQHERLLLKRNKSAHCPCRYDAWLASLTNHPYQSKITRVECLMPCLNKQRQSIV